MADRYTLISRFQGYRFAEWHPSSQPEDSPAQQVHFFIMMPPPLNEVIPEIQLRFKGPVEMRRLIQLMIFYYEDVWGRHPDGWHAVRPPEGGDISYNEGSE